MRSAVAQPNSAALVHQFTLGVADFAGLPTSSTSSIPASTLIKYATEARFVAFATWPALVRMLQEEEEHGLLEVRTQIVRYASSNRRALLRAGQPIMVKQSPHAVGADSLTIAYDFYFAGKEEEEPFAQVFALMSRGGGGAQDSRAAAAQLPAYVSEDIVWQYAKQEDLQQSADHAWMYGLLFGARNTAQGSAALGRHQQQQQQDQPLRRRVHRVLVRPSDFASSSVLSSTRVAQFFEDALFALQAESDDNRRPDLIVVEMDHNGGGSGAVAPLLPGQECDVVIAVDDGKELVLLLVAAEDATTTAPQVLARAYVHWQLKLIEA